MRNNTTENSIDRELRALYHALRVRSRALAVTAAVLPPLALRHSCASAPPPPTTAPAASPTTAPATAPRRAMVVAANPHAAQAGLDVLRAGGSAADAAVAGQAAVGLRGAA